MQGETDRAADTPAGAPVRPTASALVGVLLLVVGIGVMAAWAGQTARPELAVPGAVMVFSTALCFALVGLALIAGRALPERILRLVQPFLGCTVAAIAALVLLEHFAGLSLGIDAPDLHRRADAEAAHPGRMSVSTALTFILTGSVLVLVHWAYRLWLGLLVQGLTASVVAMGLIGLAGWLLKLHLVYENYLFGRMSLLTALMFIATGMALWLGWRRMDWYRLRALIVDESLRISLNAMVLLAVMLTLTLIAGFGIIEHQLEVSSRKQLIDPLKRRIDQFRLVLDLRSARAAMLATGPTPALMLRAFGAQAADEAARAQLRASAEASLQHGFSGIALLDPAGRVRIEVGRLASKPELEIALADRDGALLWDDGFVLRSRLPVRQGEARIGTVLAEQRLHPLTALLEYVFDFAASGDVAVCARQQEALQCFPHRAEPKAYALPSTAAVPAARALDGETGVVQLRDRGGANVVAAFGPAGSLGLGMVVTMKTSEIYAPLRGELAVVVLLLLGMVLIGAVLVHWRVAPLASRLFLQEQRLKLALDNSKSAVWDLDLRTGQVYLSEQWPTLLGGKPAASSTPLEELYKLVHADDIAQVRRKLRATLKSNDLPYDAEHRVQTPGGQWTWIHSVGKVVQRDGRGRALRMIGVNTNIARRKQEQSFVERRASRDEASGLPNRSVFTDRLHMAMTRSRRAPPDRSLMAVLIVGIDGAGEEAFAGSSGQALLKEVVQRMQHTVRATDSIARTGIDEFAIILEELGLTEQACGIAGKLIDALREPIAVADGDASLGASIGIAYYDGVIRVTGEQLVARAQQARYDARKEAPNSWRVAPH